MELSLKQFEQWNSAISLALNSLHTTEFSSALLEAIKALFYAESMIVCLEKKDLPPILLAYCGIPSTKKKLLLNRYFTMTYMIDPFCLAIKNGLPEGFYHIAEIVPNGFFESEYYKSYYLKSGTQEDCYFIIDLDSQTKISISIYHNNHDYKYSKEDIELARSAHSLIKKLAIMEWNSTSSDIINEQKEINSGINKKIEASFSEFGKDILTRRERDVTHLVLRGHSSKSAARELKISPGTVQEHRKKIYGKLEISSQSELFALFIDHISYNGDINLDNVNRLDLKK